MDAITAFNIEVDVSNCEKLYDYGHSRYHYRPADGQWDLSIFADRQQHVDISNEDENIMVQVDKMDKVINRSKFMEKQKKETDKDGKKDDVELMLWNDFDFMHPKQKLPKRVLPVLKPGDVVSGHVFLQTLQTIGS